MFEGQKTRETRREERPEWLADLGASTHVCNDFWIMRDVIVSEVPNVLKTLTGEDITEGVHNRDNEGGVLSWDRVLSSPRPSGGTVHPEGNGQRFQPPEDEEGQVLGGSGSVPWTTIDPKTYREVCGKSERG